MDEPIAGLAQGEDDPFCVPWIQLFGEGPGVGLIDVTQRLHEQEVALQMLCGACILGVNPLVPLEPQLGNEFRHGSIGLGDFRKAPVEYLHHRSDGKIPVCPSRGILESQMWWPGETYDLVAVGPWLRALPCLVVEHKTNLVSVRAAGTATSQHAVTPIQWILELARLHDLLLFLSYYGCRLPWR
jgi:hypothetical protein